MNRRRVAGSAPVIGFRRHLHVTTTPGEAVYLTSVRGTVALSGKHIQTLAPLLDGTRGLAEVHAHTSSLISPAELGGLLGRLSQANLIGQWDRAAAGRDPAQQAYWDLAGMDADRACTELARSTVRVVAVGGVDPEPAINALAQMGVPAGVDDGPAPALTMVLCADYLDPELERLNGRMLSDAATWLLAKPNGADVWIGPVFRPGAGPCWSCLAVRLRGHRRGEAWLRSTGASAELTRPPETGLPLTSSLGVTLAALEAVKWLAGARDERQDAVWALDTLTMDTRRHPAHRRPQCAACGAPDTTAGRPVALTRRRKSTVAGNGHRAMGLEQVWDRYHQLADPVTGIVSALTRDPRCPGFLHSYLSGPNLAMVDHDFSGLRAGLRAQSGGKGRTELEARVGALCEAVERYSGARHGDEPVVRGSFRALADRAVHPDDCQLFHARQFVDRDRWNAENLDFQHVPRRFDDEEVLDWTPVWSLSRKCERLLPTDLLYFNRRGNGSVRANSNGNAAGSSLEDATVQGFLELVERDAVALWWYNRTRQPSVDLASFEDQWTDELRAQYDRIHRCFWVLDLTSDLGIPVMAAVSRRVDKPEQDVMLGFGAHFDPKVALRRALTELGQLLPSVLGAEPDGTGYGPAHPHLQQWWRTATTDNQPYLRPDSGQPARAMADYEYTPTQDLWDDVEHILDLTARRGLEVLVLDQTRADVGMPVVKVVVPGLRHFWARFAAGRLYDVPVRLGRLDAPTAYDDLNPIPLFL